MLKRNLALGFLLFAASAAGSVATIPYRAVLSASNEPGTVADPAATGVVTVWLHVVRDDAGNLVSGSLDFSVSHRFSGPVTLTGMFIHLGQAGSEGPAVIQAPLPPFQTRLSSQGTLPLSQISFFNTDFPPNLLGPVNGIVADPGAYYFEILTTDSPTGAMRGQLQPASQYVRMAQLSPLNEVPPIQGTTAAGVATVFFLLTQDSMSTPTSGYVVIDVGYTGMPQSSIVTGIILDHALGVGYVVSPPPVGASGSGRVHFEIELEELTPPIIRDFISRMLFSPEDVILHITTETNPDGFLSAPLRATDHMVFPVTMTPGQEVSPPATGLVASAQAAIHVYTIRNPDGSIPAGAVVFDANPRFPGGGTFTTLQIRDAAAGKNGNLSIDAGLIAGPILAANGFGNLWRMVTVSSDTGIAALNDLVAAPERHYVNLATVQYPNGAVRAQLSPAAGGKPVVTAAISAVSDPTRTAAAPWGLMSVYGRNLAQVATGLDGFSFNDGASAFLPRMLNGTSVTVAGIRAPILYVFPDHVVIQVPAEVATGSQSVVITTPAGSSAPFPLLVQPFAPDLYFDAVGGAVFRLVQPGGYYQLVRPANPAQAGDYLTFFATGLGQTAPPLATGAIAPATPPATQPVTVTIGGQAANVVYSAAASGYSGLYQIVAQMPAGVPPGAEGLQVAVGNAPSNIVYIAVQ